MQLTGLLYVSDNREIHVLDGNRDNIAFCLAVSMKITVMLDVTPIQGYCTMNMKATCPSEMKVKFCEVKCRHIPDCANVHSQTLCEYET